MKTKIVNKTLGDGSNLWQNLMDQQNEKEKEISYKVNYQNNLLYRKTGKDSNNIIKTKKINIKKKYDIIIGYATQNGCSS